jgi:hypothetical protein
LFEASAQRIVRHLLQRGSSRLAHSLEDCGDVFIEAERDSHASKHKLAEALMSTPAPDIE